MNADTDVVMQDEDDEDDEDEVADELNEEDESEGNSFHALFGRIAHLSPEESRPHIRSKRDDWDSSDDERPELPPGENDHLTVGYNKDRTFVARGNRIGVFKTAGEGELELQGSLSQIKDMKGKTFIPIKVRVLMAFSDSKSDPTIDDVARSRQLHGPYGPQHSELIVQDGYRTWQSGRRVES